MRLSRHLARLAAITMLVGGTATFVAAASPAASASTAATQDGWVRIAHLSPKAPAMDMYMYPFGDPEQATVLRDVGYGDVSAYMAVSPEESSSTTMVWTVSAASLTCMPASEPDAVKRTMCVPGTTGVYDVARPKANCRASTSGP